MLLSVRGDAGRADEALLRAAARGDLKGCQDALARGARCGCVDEHGMSAMHWCAVHWDALADIAGDLIERRGDAWAKDRAGRTALDILLC